MQKQDGLFNRIAKEFVATVRPTLVFSLLLVRGIIRKIGNLYLPILLLLSIFACIYLNTFTVAVM